MSRCLVCVTERSYRAVNVRFRLVLGSLHALACWKTHFMSRLATMGTVLHCPYRNSPACGTILVCKRPFPPFHPTKETKTEPNSMSVQHLSSFVPWGLPKTSTVGLVQLHLSNRRNSALFCGWYSDTIIADGVKRWFFFLGSQWGHSALSVSEQHVFGVD